MTDPFDEDPWSSSRSSGTQRFAGSSVSGTSWDAPDPFEASEGAQRTGTIRSRPGLRAIACVATVVALVAAVTSAQTNAELVSYVVALVAYAGVWLAAWRVAAPTGGGHGGRGLPSIYRLLRPIGFLAVTYAAWGAAQAMAL